MGPSNVGSMPAVAGATACLVDPFYSSSIWEEILRIIEDADSRNRLIEGGFENAKRPRADGIAAQYAALYRKLR